MNNTYGEKAAEDIFPTNGGNIAQCVDLLKRLTTLVEQLTDRVTFLEKRTNQEFDYPYPQRPRKGIIDK